METGMESWSEVPHRGSHSSSKVCGHYSEGIEISYSEGMGRWVLVTALG